MNPCSRARHREPLRPDRRVRSSLEKGKNGETPWRRFPIVFVSTSSKSITSHKSHQRPASPWISRSPPPAVTGCGSYGFCLYLCQELIQFINLFFQVKTRHIESGSGILGDFHPSLFDPLKNFLHENPGAISGGIVPHIFVRYLRGAAPLLTRSRHAHTAGRAAVESHNNDFVVRLVVGFQLLCRWNHTRNIVVHL